MVAVRIEGLTKRFQVRRSRTQMARHPWRREWTTSLDRVSCEIHTGEFFGLLGPNGAGKTTLFKILATLVAPDEGTATVHGHDVLLHFEHERMSLQCTSCGYQTPGWDVKSVQRTPLRATTRREPAAVVRMPLVHERRVA